MGLALASAVLMVIVALLASSGFTGNIRYVALPMALLAVLAGIGWGWVATVVRPRVAARRARRSPRCRGSSARRRPVTATSSACASSTPPTPTCRGVIERAGAARACCAAGRSSPGPFRPRRWPIACTWHQNQVGIFPEAPGSILDLNGTRLGSTPGFERVVLRTKKWVLRQSCR